MKSDKLNYIRFNDADAIRPAVVHPWLTAHWQSLSRQIEAGRLHHAILISGADGLGKRDLAHALAHRLLCQRPVPMATGNEKRACGQCESCGLLVAGTHPDFYIVKPMPPEKTTSKNPVLSIRIDTIRDLCRALSQTSQHGGYRIAIIEEANAMNASAANSLLKTLEEPGQRTVLILTSSSPARLPVTIRSRCQQRKLKTPGFGQVADWLMAAGEFVSSQDAEKVFRLCHQAPLLARDYERGRDWRELLEQALLSASEGRSPILLAAKLADGDRQMLLHWMLDWVNDLIYLSADPGSSRVLHHHQRDKLLPLAQRARADRLFGLRSLIMDTLQQGAIALNAQLLWENLLISWDNLRY